MMNVEKYLNIPYVVGKMDCWGLIKLIYKQELNISLADYIITETKLNDKAKAVDKAYNIERGKWREVDIYEARLYDVICFNLCGLIMHVGLVLDNKDMIHLETVKTRSVVECYKSLKWFKRITRVYRYEHNC